ncbi:hypothetical protein MHYP_G00285080 [Metynnis hypsauchen]
MSGEEAPGQKRRCFPEILDLVFRLSDGALRTVMTDLSNEVSQLQFAALGTHTVISAAKSVLQRCVPTLIGPAGMETALLEEENLRKRTEPESADSTGPSSSTSAERSSVDQSDGTCDAVEDFLREVMEKSICKLTSSKASPLPGNWKTSSSPLTKEMLNLLEVSPSNSEEDLFAGLESREYLQTKTPKAVEEKIRELKEGADTSSETPESLVAQPVHIVSSRETTANHVSQRDDLAISCTNDVSGLHHQSASRAVWNIPALNTGSTALIRSPRWTVSPIFQLHFNSCMNAITMKVVQIHKSELLLSSSSNVSLLNSMFFPKQPVVGVSTVMPQRFITEAGEAASGATSHEEDIVFEELGSAPQIVGITQPQFHQRQHLTSNEMLRCHGHELTRSTFNYVRNRTGPLHIWKCSSEPLWISNDLLRDPLQVSSVQVTEFMNLDVSSFIPASSGGTDPSASLMVLDQDVQGTSASVEAQEKTSNTALSLTYRTSGEMEDPLALLLNCEQAKSERMEDIFAGDMSLAGSPNPPIKAGSETVRDTLANRSTSSQETSSSSSSPLNGREPEAVRKRSRGLRFFGGRKAPFISFGQKKSTKAGPAGVESTNHQADSGNHQSDSGNHQSDSGSQLSCSAQQRESTVTPFRKARKRLSRFFSAVCKALPNPCSCMCPPS